MNKKIITISAFLLTSLPALVLAQNGVINNPLNGGNSIADIFKNILNFIESAGAIVSTIAFVYGGFLYVKARGNPKELDTAHQFMKGTIIGTIILVSASLIGEVIQTTVNNLK